MKQDDLIELWKAEANAGMQGWDFSHLSGRWLNEELPWDYRRIVLFYLHSESRLLDMGTGGGEFLLSLDHPPHLTSVTEAYEPNLALCRRTLEPLGITVARPGEKGELPFPEKSFDLVINRHESFNADEVYRVLQENGVFITQQVGSLNNRELSSRLIPGFEPLYSEHTLEKNVMQLVTSNFKVLRAEKSLSPLRFLDTGALVYYASLIEWEFPGFSVEGCLNALLHYQKEIEEKGFVEGTEDRFLIVARKN